MTETSSQPQDSPPRLSRLWQIAGPWRAWFDAQWQRLWDTAAGRRAHELFFTGDEKKYLEPAMGFLNADRLIGTGLVVTLVFVGGFFGWAALAPLDSALLAPGVVVVESHRKAIQHLEGGIVSKIFVTDGQIVKAGQLLVQLDDTEAKANLDMTRGEADALTAQEARLEAERDGADAITFPPDLLARQADPKVAEAIRGEQSTFDTHRETLTKQAAIYTQRSAENKTIIAGLEKEQAAVDKQIELIGQESDSVQQLYAKGLSTLQRLLALQRQAADLSGQRGQIVEKMAQVQLDSGENELQIVNLRNQQMSDTVKDLRDVQTKRFDMLDRLHAAKGVFGRLRLVAPVAGKVAELAVHTTGAVIKPGDTVMEIVPLNDQLDVEAHVRPEDADGVHVGMAAKITMSGYKQRQMPLITGTVTNVSADRIVDQRTGQAYFNVDVSVDRKQAQAFGDVKLIPGLPVDVAIDTGTRTAMDYFVDPITSVFRKGMREK
jgi:HlyD family secretion protein